MDNEELNVVAAFSAEGFCVIYSPDLRKPRLERERGAGYVNVSAVERNRALMDDASRVFWLPAEQAIVIPSFLRAAFEAATGKPAAR